MAKKKTKKKTVAKSRSAGTRSKTTRSSARSRSTAKSRTGASKKKTTKKKTTRKKTKRPTTKKRSTSKKTAKKASTRRAVTKKRTTRKKTKKKVAKKRPAKRAAAKRAGQKKKTKKKTKAPAKKTTKKPVKKTAQKTAKKAPAKSTKSGAKSTKKTTKRKRTGRRALGAQSVAEAASASEADAQGYVFVNGRRVRMISTKGQPVTKKSRSRKADTNAVEPERSAKPVKTKLSTKELRHYEQVLLEKRGELVGDVSAMETAALKTSGGNLSNLPIHMADIGSDTYDQDFTLGLAETERKRLIEIDEALLRIRDRTYGVCAMTQKPIPKTRLNAKPWAKYTIEAARELERRWQA